MCKKCAEQVSKAYDDIMGALKAATNEKVMPHTASLDLLYRLTVSLTASYMVAQVQSAGKRVEPEALLDVAPQLVTPAIQVAMATMHPARAAAEREFMESLLSLLNKSGNTPH